MRIRRLIGGKLILGLALIALLLLGAIKLTRHRNAVLVAKAQRLSLELIAFSDSRALLTQRKSNESFETYRNRIMADDAETQSLYMKLYYDQVARLRAEFARRGLTDRDLDEFYERPTLPLGVRDVGNRLSHMAETLQSR